MELKLIILGPTYNCKILNAFEDGRPSKYNDPSCQPGYLYKYMFNIIYFLYK